MVVEPDRVPEPAPIGLCPNVTELRPVLILSPDEGMPERLLGHESAGSTTIGTSGRSSSGENPNTFP